MREKIEDLAARLAEQVEDLYGDEYDAETLNAVYIPLVETAREILKP